MPADLVSVLLIATSAAFAISVLSSVGGPGGGALLLGVFTALFGIRIAVPILTVTQLASNGARTWFNRGELRWRPIGWFAIGAVPMAAVGGVLLAHAPAGPLKRLLGAFLVGVVVWRRVGMGRHAFGVRVFTAAGAVSGLGSSLLGSAGPLTAPLFLAFGLTRAAYVGTEAASSLTMHLTKIATYGVESLLTGRVLLYGVALTPATLAGAWLGRTVVDRISDRVFVLVVEAGLVATGVVFLIGL